MLGASIVDSVFYDVFAGTGVVGIDALSRGAARAVFVERDRRQVSLIRENLSLVGLVSSASVRGSDAFAWARHFFPEPDPIVVFLGPPYPMFDTQAERELMRELVASVQSRLEPKDTLVLQMPSSPELPFDLPDPEGWIRDRKYGKTRICIWQATKTEEVVPPNGVDEDVVDPNED